MRTILISAAALLALPFAGCAPVPPAPATPPAAAPPVAGPAAVPVADDAIGRGQAFARAHCAACHALPPVRLSPNPESPAFEEIANQPGLTRATLTEFLRDSHNYPAVMRFEIEPTQIDDLAAYMLSLRQTR